MPDTALLLARSALHLEVAANLAERADPALAGQIRLAAATMPADTWPDAADEAAIRRDDSADVADHLELALDCLDQIAPLAGPADLQLCAWHIHELRRIATAGIAS